MKSKFSTLILSAALAMSGAAFTGNAFADEGKMVGPVTKIKLAPDGKSAVATLKDAKTGEQVNVTVSDDLTLGFVFLYLWRTEELMELEVTQ